MTKSNLEREQDIQESEYTFPYHYIPQWSSRHFSQNRYWSWGFRYIGGLLVVLDQLKQMSFESLIDIGCGDGRFIQELQAIYPNARILGIDYSAHAISMAQAMNPQGAYRQANVILEDLDELFDVATCIEVLEHIPLNDVSSFIKGLASTIRPGGTLVLTVPHINLPTSKKHYQHFSSEKLLDVLGEDFEGFVFIPFDLMQKTVALGYYLFSRTSKYVLITHPGVTGLLFNIYKSFCLYVETEKNCGRIAVVCMRKM
jgi:2-polyprenyl-3-methyl-5-hydroxy-6-metoxy-1,4-benzoquinol methylase